MLVGAHASVVDTHASVIDMHASVIDMHASVIDTHASVIDTHASVIDTHASAVDTHASVVDTHASAVDAYASVIVDRRFGPAHRLLNRSKPHRRPLAARRMTVDTRFQRDAARSTPAFASRTERSAQVDTDDRASVLERIRQATNRFEPSGNGSGVIPQKPPAAAEGLETRMRVLRPGPGCQFKVREPVRVQVGPPAVKAQ